MAFSGAVIFLPEGNVQAASKTKLSKKSISLDMGVKKTLKLKNARHKVKWRSSNKKVAVVTAKRGKRGSVITIKAKKSGKCTITAKCGKKTYKCKVKVSNVRIRKLGSSSVEKSSAYKLNKKLGASGNNTFNVAVTDFSLNLMGVMLDSGIGKNGSRNILISPDSILTAMVMMENGAAGNTRKEMSKVMSSGISAGDFNRYMAGLNNRMCSSDKSMIYRQANSLWIRKGKLKVKKSYLKKNKQYHNIQVYEAPFNSGTVKDINNWVYNNTRNMISKIINSLSSDDRMVVVNATAFEGKWALPFDAPHKLKFTAYDGTESKVRTLTDTGSYRYIKLKGGVGFAKPYAASNSKHAISFVGLVPPEGTDVNEYAKSINGNDWIKAWKSSKYHRLDISVPEFKYDFSASLAKPLYRMGIHDAFTSKADFSGISATGPKLQIDDVLHKTHIELDRNGTKAAAATAIVMKASSAYMEEPPIVHLDRPFLYALVDNKTGIPLFIGIMYKVN